MHKFVQTPERFPHQCMSCFSGVDREYYLDLGEDNNSPDFTVPTVYICNLCLVAIAKEKGLVDEKPLLEKMEQLESKLFNAKVVSEALEHGLDDLFRARFLDSDSDSAVELVSFLETVEDGKGSSSESGEAVDGKSGASAK